LPEDWIRQHGYERCCKPGSSRWNAFLGADLGSRNRASRFRALCGFGALILWWGNGKYVPIPAPSHPNPGLIGISMRNIMGAHVSLKQSGANNPPRLLLAGKQCRPWQRGQTQRDGRGSLRFDYLGTLGRGLMAIDNPGSNKIARSISPSRSRGAASTCSF